MKSSFLSLFKLSFSQTAYNYNGGTMYDNQNTLYNEQIIAEVLYIISLLISIYLLFKKKSRTDGTDYLGIENRLFLVLIYLFLIWIAIQAFKRSKNKLDFLLVITAIIAIFPPIVDLYASWIVNVKNIQTTKNPIL